MFSTYVFPSEFAKRIADKLDIPECLSSDGPEGTIKTWEMLREFCQIGVAIEFEKSLIVYHDYNLTNEQLKGLKIIHESIKPHLLGHIVGLLLSQENNKTIEVADLIINKFCSDDKQLDDITVRKLIGSIMK